MATVQSARASLQRSRAATDDARRFVDLCLQFEIVDGPKAGTILDPYGGRWDLLAGQYVGWWEPGKGWYGDEPQHIHTIKLAQQCVGYVQDWEHLLIMAEGGRRSGKTTGALAPKLVVCMLVFAALPGEVLSPTYRQTRNVRKSVIRHVPRHWWKTWPVPITPPITLEMVHGSTATLLTAANEDSARSEGVAWGAYDERQDIPEASFGNALLSTSEAEDTPFIFETATIKPELREHHDKLIASDMGSIYTMDSYDNCFINTRFLDLAKEFLDDETVDREIHAKWPELFGRIFGAWDKDRHVVRWPLRQREDATAAILGEKFNMPQYGRGSPQWYITIDPPATGGLFKLYDDETMHLVHEVLIGADGASGGVEDLAASVRGLIGEASAVVVQDPHEHKWDVEVVRQFKRAGGRQFRFASLRHLPVIYKHASVRARAKRDRLLVDPSCPHGIEVLEKHKYLDDGSARPDKQQCYSKNYQRESKRIQLVHLGDVLGYACYKLWPTQVDYEKLEKDAA